MSKREILVNSLKGLEVAIATTKEKLAELDKPEPKPELRHGDYGFSVRNGHFVVMKQSDKPKAFFADGGGQRDVNGVDDDQPNEYGYTKYGNIFDDLKRNSEDLEKFKIEDGFVYWENGGLWIEQEGDVINISEDIEEFHQQLGQLISTARRRQGKE